MITIKKNNIYPLNVDKFNELYDKDTKLFGKYYTFVNPSKNNTIQHNFSTGGDFASVYVTFDIKKAQMSLTTDSDEGMSHFFFDELTIPFMRIPADKELAGYVVNFLKRFWKAGIIELLEPPLENKPLRQKYPFAKDSKTIDGAILDDEFDEREIQILNEFLSIWNNRFFGITYELQKMLEGIAFNFSIANSLAERIVEDFMLDMLTYSTDEKLEHEHARVIETAQALTQKEDMDAFIDGVKTELARLELAQIVDLANGITDIRELTNKLYFYLN